MSDIDPMSSEYEFDWQKPGLNKFDFGRTFSRTIDILKAEGVRMLILSALLIGLPTAVINMWPIFMAGGMQDVLTSNDPSAIMSIFTGASLAFLIIGVILLIVASLWLQPSLIKISYGTLTHQQLPLGTVLRQSTSYVLPVLGYFIIYGLAVMLGMILLIIPGILIALGWMLAAHIIVLENQGVSDSISRAWELARGHKRWLLLLAIVFGIIGAVINVVVLIPVYFMEDPNVAMLQGASTPYWIINGLLTAVGQAIVTIIGVAWATSAYVELRKVKEGIDPESQVDVFN